MFLVVDGREVEVVVHDPDATVADLWPPGPADLRLRDLDLRDGDELPAPAAVAVSGLGLVVVGGLGAGDAVVVPPGATVLVGRSAGAQVLVDDPAVAPLHAAVTLSADRRSVRWRELRASTGSWVVPPDPPEPLDPPDPPERPGAPGPDGQPPNLPRDGDRTGRVRAAGSARIRGEAHLAAGAEVRIGASRLAVRPVDRPARRPSPVHHRPPRTAPPPPPPPPAEVPAPPPPPPPPPLSTVTVVAPLAMAGLMVAALGNLAFALFALLSPVLAVGTHLEGRRRHRAATRRAAGEHRVAVAAAAHLDRRCRRHEAPDPGEVIARTHGPSPRLWERRPGHADWLRVGAGTAPDGAPVVVDLAAGPVGVVGCRPAALAVARWLLLQAAVHHGPADLRLSVPPVAAWDWAKWLPHLDGDRPQLVAVEPAVTELPADTVVVVDVDAATVTRVADGTTWVGVRLDGLAEPVARAAARRLAGVVDPAAGPVGHGLPDRVRLPPLLGGCSRPGHARTPIGVGLGGPVIVDLDADGPHALVAGTTGAGKSELLRTLVTGLAAGHTPDELTFVLVDFKGGSAFDACARLPHVVGLVTDLDAALAARALRCLEAELRYRERRLRAAGASDLRSFRRVDGEAPLPRLVVVIDEFATLRADLPDFVDALVDVAQRGRSLGVHLVLATQRPAGAVSEAIRANTNLRIALRMQEPSESVDVIGRPDAAGLPRAHPGRAFVRLGPGDVVAVQTALVTAAAGPPTGPVEVRPFVLGGAPPVATAVDGPSDLEVVVERCVAAWAGRPPPRRPWPDPLPARLDPDAVPPLAVGLLDDPDRQRQVPVGWDPAAGPLLVEGPRRCGATTAALAALRSLPEARVAAVDAGGGGLAPLGRAVVGATDLERQARLVRRLRSELDRRRGGGVGDPVVLLVDRVGSFRSGFDDMLGADVLDAFARVVADGPAVGIHVVLVGPGLPLGLVAAVRQHWVAAEGGPPGRFVDRASGLAFQVAAPSGRDLARPALEVPVLPPVVRALGPASTGCRPWSVPIGLADDDLGPADLPLHEGDHVLVAGPPRSGRTTALATIAAAAVSGGLPVAVVAGRRSRLGAVPGVAVHPGLAAALASGAPLVLVDDADGVDGELPDDAGAHVVAAGRADALRTRYGHWTGVVRRSRLGLLLRPDPALDGDLLGVTLPRRSTSPPAPGRGYLVADGGCRLVQVAASGP